VYLLPTALNGTGVVRPEGNAYTVTTKG